MDDATFGDAENPIEYLRPLVDHPPSMTPILVDDLRVQSNPYSWNERFQHLCETPVGDAEVLSSPTETIVEAPPTSYTYPHTALCRTFVLCIALLCYVCALLVSNLLCVVLYFVCLVSWFVLCNAYGILPPYRANKLHVQQTRT